MTRQILVSRLFFTFALTAGILLGQDASSDSDKAKEKEMEPGIPVTDQLTIAKCSGCHAKDDKGNLSRISWDRTTPEGWQEVLKRMVRLNGLQLSADEARHIVRYLAQDHGLAPAEVKPVSWFLEMRQYGTEEYPSQKLRRACASCHTLAKPMTWRRSKAEWQLLANMHIGYYTVAQFYAFRDRAPEPNTPEAANFRQPIDIALEYFSKNYGLYSAEWSNWHAQASDPELKGRWLVTAKAAGKGKYVGTLTIDNVSPGEFKTEAVLTSLRDGSTIKLPGKALVYTGYLWRGSGKADGIGSIRQVMALDADQSKLEGRWFWGDYQEFGFDVTATRDTGGIAVLGTDVTAIHAGDADVPLKIMGQRFPSDIAAGDVKLGPGLHVTKVVSVKPDEIRVLVTADAKLNSGHRSVSVRGQTAPNALAAYEKIDYIKVSAETALSHLGGTVAKKGFVQYEAEAFISGADGVPHTEDDISLGPVPVKWSIEEFLSRNKDDDKEFVGFIDQNGLFTPASDGPNPQRRFSTNNTGDVWVVARYVDKDNPKPLEAKGYLVVTVPALLRWDEPEVGQ